MTAAIGTNIDKMLITTDAPSSSVATIAFPIPPVVVVEAALVSTVLPCTKPATPPPAMTARVQRMNGETSPINEADTKMPDTIAAGVEIVSSK